MHMIDISQFNTVNDWEKVKKNVEGIVIRLGYRGCTTGTITYDPKFNEFVAACEKYGIPYSIYFFPCSITDAEAHSEAKFILAAAEKLNLSFPIYLDSEVVKRDRTGRSDRLSREVRTRLLNIILQDLKNAGYNYGVYASTSWWANNLVDSQILAGCSRWVAQYASSCTYKGTKDLWQFTSDGSIPGIQGRVDMSQRYVELKARPGEKKEPQPVVHSRQDIVTLVKSWEGFSEANGKHKKIVDIYNYHLAEASKKLGTLNYKLKYTDAWCAGMASAAYIQSGMGDMFPIECSCPRMINIAKKMGIWKEADNYVPAPGDAVLYDWQDNGVGDNTGNPDHVGIVISVSGSSFVVMEGNYDDAVKRRTMAINGRYIRGFVVPKFEDNTVKPEEEHATTEVKPSYGSQKATSSTVFAVSGKGSPNKTCKFTGEVTASALNVRTWAGVQNPKCSFTPLYRGTKVEVCDWINAKTGEKWYYIRKNGKYGFVSAQYVKEV